MGPGLNEANHLRDMEQNLREILFVPKTMLNYVKPSGSAFHKHHIFPNQFGRFFERAGITIDSYTVSVHSSIHTKAIHHPPGSLGWNKEWKNFIEANPSASRAQIFNQAQRMIVNFGVSGEVRPYRSPANSVGPR